MSGRSSDTDPEPSVPPGPLVPLETIPAWLRPLAADVDAVTSAVENRGGDRTRLLAALKPNRRSAAVLIAVAGPDGPDTTPPPEATVLLTARATTLRNHAGQVAFPGGARDPGDDYPVGTALREATEETGLAAADVTPIARLRSFPVPPSGFDVIPVLAWSAQPTPVRVVDTGETSRVVRVPIANLVDPANRFQVQRSVMGGRVYRGPAFAVEGMLVWGFTGGLLAAVFDAAGWARPWDTDDIRDLNDELAKAGQR
ncbi:NUDIX hydrolase [Williamsia deligens]|uniref:NUDIX hydrolase n=1 Tax=Williamsia deligens TaxID=321325 RepID=A0ABW3GAC7_9NOCA|nr:CoA pyrophosphatase [Williamsia deligens]MCP2193289.1 NUDIX domain-containing protein [Williamsia deligens]